MAISGLAGKNYRLIILCVSVIFLNGCVQKSQKKYYDNSDILFKLNNTLSEAIIYDGFSPPVASRIYAYCNIAANEALCVSANQNGSVIQKLNGFEKNNYKYENELNDTIVLITAFCEVAKKLVYRGYLIDSIQTELMQRFSGNLANETILNSTVAGKDIFTQINKRIATDNYGKTRNMPKFVPSGKEGSWKPTAPMYADGLEPYWGTIMPFFLDSASQFQVDAGEKFSIEKTSAFYKQNLEVYELVNKNSQENLDVALFWDCNPLRTNVTGHLSFKTRQLNPGGHWLEIANDVCKVEKKDLFTSSFICAMVSIAVADGFIVCWKEKFRLNTIRPETYIQLYIDKDWKPLLETPPFPELPSGHSTISAAAANVLEHFYGKNFSYIDSTEVPFGMQPRHFNSFIEAAKQAAVSRLYGGIHYHHACDEGYKLGEKVSGVLLTKITN